MDIEKIIRRIHPNCLIRDIRVERETDTSVRVSYLAVKKDDTHRRLTITIEQRD